MGKPSYATYIKDRLNGFGGTATTTYVFQDIEALPLTKARVAADPGAQAPQGARVQCADQRARHGGAADGRRSAEER